MFTLIVPHFLRPKHAPVSSLNTPVLNQMLRRCVFQAAEQNTGQLYVQHLCDQLTLNDHCVYASPMSQQMGMNQISAQHGSSLAVTPEEARHFCESLNALYGKEARFDPVRPDLWCVQFPRKIDWQVESIFNLNTILQAERVPADYLQLTTEIQMCLHTHHLNQARKHCPINHLHLWVAPKPHRGPPEYAAIATHSVWRQQSSLKHHAPQNWQDWLHFCETENLDIETTAWFDESFIRTEDEASYKQAVEHWDKQMARALQHALQTGQLSAFQLICERGVCEFHTPNMWAFWKRAKVFDGTKW